MQGSEDGEASVSSFDRDEVVSDEHGSLGGALGGGTGSDLKEGYCNGFRDLQ